MYVSLLSQWHTNSVFSAESWPLERPLCLVQVPVWYQKSLGTIGCILGAEILNVIIWF